MKKLITIVLMTLTFTSCTPDKLSTEPVCPVKVYESVHETYDLALENPLVYKKLVATIDDCTILGINSELYLSLSKANARINFLQTGIYLEELPMNDDTYIIILDFVSNKFDLIY